MLQSLMSVNVVGRTEEATDIAVFELAHPTGIALPPFGAGAHIDVEIAPGLTRQYSLCNAPSEVHRYVIGVLRDPVSRGGSVAMHALKLGDELRISEPRNHFPLAASATNSLLLAGGIGVTPILCMAERLAHAGAPFAMHYGVRSPDRAAFRSRIAASSFADKVHFHFDDGPASQKLDLPAALAALGRDGHLYVCGPGKFMNFVIDGARVSGLPEANIHREFFGVDVATLEADSDAFQVKIASTGRVFDIPADRPVTAVLMDHGIEIPVSCEQGVCGTCLTRVLEGTPDHRDLYLSVDEQSRNDQFTPCCSRSKSRLLVLDL